MAAVSTLKLNLREKFKLLAETRVCRILFLCIHCVCYPINLMYAPTSQDSESKLLQQNQSLLSRVANLETCIRDEQTLNQSLQSKLEVFHLVGLVYCSDLPLLLSHQMLYNHRS
jgi:hypothetical protein